MKLTLESIGEALRSYYDRLIALAAILALLVSLALLMMRLGGIKAESQRFQNWETGLRPEFPDASAVTLDAFDAGHAALAEPFQASVWTRKLSIPELRVSCIDCTRPIPYDADECWRCGAKQLKNVDIWEDKDDDGMLDEWELAHGLNPLDPDDAHKDSDGDGFTNLEEFSFKTDPKDPGSAPPVIAKLRVAGIKTMPFHLKFMAVNVIGGQENFQINNSKWNTTAWYKKGQTVEGGYAITEYKRVAVKEEVKGIGLTTVDRSELTLRLQASGRTITLRKGEEVPVSEHEVQFLLEIDGSEFTVKHGADFDLRGQKFTLKEIDNKTSRVLIQAKDSAKETWIGRQAESSISVR